MPISEYDQAILDAFQEVADEDPDLSKYFEFYRTLYEALASAKAGISASLEMVDGEALQARLQEGLPMLSFGQLPLEEERFAELASEVAGLLEEHEPGLAGQAPCDDGASCLALARQRFEDMQARSSESEDAGEATLDEISVDLALNPYLEWAAEFVLPHVDQQRWRRKYCPVCGGPPDFSYLEQDAGARYLLCSRCSSSWLYRRLGCPFCGTSDHTKVSYYLGDDKAYRLYVCQACLRYLKTMDLRGLARQVQFPVERATTVAMDVAAHEAGYH
jgi:formate dehydrogenase maturation protein FdhE